MGAKPEAAAVGWRVTAMLAAWLGSASAVAVRVTLCGTVMTDGAVYCAVAVPVETRLPIGALSDHVTAEFADPVTVAVNACTPDCCKLAAVGLTAIATTGGGAAEARISMALIFGAPVTGAN